MSICQPHRVMFFPILKHCYLTDDLSDYCDAFVVVCCFIVLCIYVTLLGGVHTPLYRNCILKVLNPTQVIEYPVYCVRALVGLGECSSGT